MKKIILIILAFFSLTSWGQSVYTDEEQGSFTFSVGSSITITDQSPITLTPSVSSECTEFLWTTSGTGVFADSTAKNTTYTPSVADIILDSIVLSLESNCGIGDSAKIWVSKIVYFNVYEFEAKELFTSLTTPLSDTAMLKVNNLIVMLKDSIGIDTLSEFFDRFYLLANETVEASVYDLCDSALARRCTAVNSPTHAAFEGFTFNGTSNYLNTNYNPKAQGINYTLNNAGIAAYSRTNASSFATIKSLTGIYSSTTNSHTGLTPSYNNLAYLYLHTITGTAVRTSSTSSIGYFMVTRNGALEINLKGGVNYNYVDATDPSTTVDIPNYSFYIGARNSIGSPAYYIDCQVAIVFFSGYISEENNRKILNCIEYYMDSNGKGIVP